uniref:Uncharacterized protein n=1 Tax=Globisporangium ultimum (strain ATCC 200006 / CBS 805.95 / DAOM BR144) TaxID=431595 RepID=K3X6S6_GLOUD
MASSTASAHAPKPQKKKKLLQKVVGFVGRNALSLCWVTYVVGLVWVLLHPAVTVSTGELKPRGTYISENALLIDSFDARSSHNDVNVARELHRVMLEEIPALPPTGCGDECALTVAWLTSKLRAIDRVDAYHHTFVDRSLRSRTNVYGILRASPLADGKESVVLVTHYRNVGAQNGEYSGVSLSLALLAYLVDAKWLAKDIILLFADDGSLDGIDGFAPGTEAWLQAYHLDPLQLGQQQSGLPMRAGVIRAAVNIETLMSSSKMNAVGILTAGINGQLPNLDLVNTAVTSLRGEHIPVVLDRCDSEHSQPGFCRQDTLSKVHEQVSSILESYVPAEYKHQAREYLKNLHGMLRFMTTLASGPSGAHAHFISYNIDSITLITLENSGNDGGSTTLSPRAILRAVEKIVRAMSNLEEKLHQSFFLYVLPNTKHFVSIGEYYYTVALAVSPAIAHLGYLASKTVGMRVASGLAALLIVELVAIATLTVVARVYASSSGSELSSASWWYLVLAVSLMQAIIVVFVLPLLRSSGVISGCDERRAWWIRVATYEDEHNEEATSSEPPTKTSSERKAELLADIPEQDSGWRCAKFVVMILLVYSHCIIGIINYPMALFCAIPMALFSLIEPLGVAKSVVKKVWCALWLLLSSPIVLFAAGYAMDPIGFLGGLRYVVDSFALRVNLLALPYLCCLYIPVHTLSIGIWLHPVANDNGNAVTTKAKKEN